MQTMSNEAIRIQPPNDPNESWPDKMLLDCGREAIKESDLLESQAQPLIRQSIGSRLRGGHAMSILRARLKSEGRWLRFQQDNALPRTTLWQMIEVYERAAKDGYTAQALAGADMTNIHFRATGKDIRLPEDING